jgi:molybdenum cofactor guanylyltransferase
MVDDRAVMTSGAVLTGGSSRRFGSPKALALVEGVPMALRVARALSDGGCDPVVAVGSVPGLADIWGGEILADRWPGQGPLGGVLTALANCEADVVTAACDLPWLDAYSVSALVAKARAIDGVEAVHGSRDGRLVPVIWWSQRARPQLELAFAQGLRSLHGALSQLVVAEVEFSALASKGANSPGDVPS